MEINIKKMKKKYTNERNVQIVISLLKAYGIKRVIASPGTTNMTFVGSIQQDSWFEIYSSVDERSAAYLACGMAAETGEPVVISCTGATASRNYMPGLTEAYYRKLPVLAITSHRGDASIGHLLDQQIDRRQIPNDIAMQSVTVPLVTQATDENYCVIEASKAILALFHRGGGPAHINLHTSYSRSFDVTELPATRVIRRFEDLSSAPIINDNLKVAVFVGSHAKMNVELQSALESFCETYNAIIISDHTSGYYGKYKIPFALLGGQVLHTSTFKDIDLLIHIGEVSGDAYGRGFSPRRVWRVSLDGELRDMYHTLTDVFEVEEVNFFRHYAKVDVKNTTRYEQYKKEYSLAYNNIENLPFGNIWIAKEIHHKLPQNSELHLGILNSLRSWDFFSVDSSIETYSNVGGFGIDGGVSSMLGASLVNQNKLYFGVFGDLAFFYDMNVLGNRHIGNNVRLLLINNGRGNEFRLSMHPCSIFGQDADKYMAAAGHYGNQSSLLVKHYAENLGYKYISASTKEEFNNVVDVFLNPVINQSIVFEVFTQMEDETSALDMTLRSLKDSSQIVKDKIKSAIKNSPLKPVAEKVISIIRK